MYNPANRHAGHSMTTAPARKFSTATSVFLDVLRLMSAIIIAGVHLTQPFFSTGWPDLTDQGKPALVMLFLLSGLVIRYVTVLRRGQEILDGAERAQGLRRRLVA